MGRGGSRHKTVSGDDTACEVLSEAGGLCTVRNDARRRLRDFATLRSAAAACRALYGIGGSRRRRPARRWWMERDDLACGGGSGGSASRWTRRDRGTDGIYETRIRDRSHG